MGTNIGSLVELAIDYNANGRIYKKGDIGIISGYTLFFHSVTLQESGDKLNLMDDEINFIE